MMPQKAPHSSSPDRNVPRRLASPAPPVMSPAQTATGLGCHQPGASSPSLWATKAEHHTMLAPIMPGHRAGPCSSQGSHTSGQLLAMWHMAIYRYIHSYRCILVFKGAHTDLREPTRRFTGTHTHIYGHTHIAKCTQLFTGTHTWLQAHTELYRHAQLHTPAQVPAASRPAPLTHLHKARLSCCHHHLHCRCGV